VEEFYFYSRSNTIVFDSIDKKRYLESFLLAKNE